MSDQHHRTGLSRAVAIRYDVAPLRCVDILRVCKSIYFSRNKQIICHFFSKKRQWQDLNLRIQRIIDFKSIALDHSATLSDPYYPFFFPLVSSLVSFFLFPFSLLSLFLFLYFSFSLFIFLYQSLYFFFLYFFLFLPQVPSIGYYSVISNSIVGQYLRLSRERPGFESPLESFCFFYFVLMSSAVSPMSALFVCMGVQLRWQSIRFACEGHGDRYPASPLLF